MLNNRAKRKEEEEAKKKAAEEAAAAEWVYNYMFYADKCSNFHPHMCIIYLCNSNQTPGQSVKKRRRK